jgi:hypothetical protein
MIKFEKEEEKKKAFNVFNLLIRELFRFIYFPKRYTIKTSH